MAHPKRRHANRPPGQTYTVTLTYRDTQFGREVTFPRAITCRATSPADALAYVLTWFPGPFETYEVRCKGELVARGTDDRPTAAAS